MPEFLRFKRYADFRKGYEDAFKDLLIPIKSIAPSSIGKEDDQRAISRLSRLQLFKEVFTFANSSSYMNMLKTDARKFDPKKERFKKSSEL